MYQLLSSLIVLSIKCWKKVKNEIYQNHTVHKCIEDVQPEIKNLHIYVVYFHKRHIKDAKDVFCQVIN